MIIHRFTVKLAVYIFLLELFELSLVDLVDALDLLVILLGFNVQISNSLAGNFQLIGQSPQLHLSLLEAVIYYLALFNQSLNFAIFLGE